MQSCSVLDVCVIICYVSQRSKRIQPQRICDTFSYSVILLYAVNSTCNSKSGVALGRAQSTHTQTSSLDLFINVCSDLTCLDQELRNRSLDQVVAMSHIPDFTWDSFSRFWVQFPSSVLQKWPWPQVFDPDYDLELIASPLGPTEATVYTRCNWNLFRVISMHISRQKKRELMIS